MLALTPSQFKTVRSILNQCVPGVSVKAFGSRVNGKAKKFSDLDLCIHDQQKLSAEKFMELTGAFAESDLPFKVDVVDWHDISENFKKLIDAHAEDFSLGQG